MRLPALILWLLSTGIVVYVQIWYAKIGYPNVLKAKLGLFLSGFLCGAFGAWFVFAELSAGMLGGTMVIFGVLMGIYSSFIFPGKTESWIPKRKNE